VREHGGLGRRRAADWGGVVVASVGDFFSVA
jgi:hypothetical protein